MWLCCVFIVLVKVFELVCSIWIGVCLVVGMLLVWWIDRIGVCSFGLV